MNLAGISRTRKKVLGATVEGRGKHLMGGSYTDMPPGANDVLSGSPGEPLWTAVGRSYGWKEQNPGRSREATSSPPRTETEHTHHKISQPDYFLPPAKLRFVVFTRRPQTEYARILSLSYREHTGGGRTDGQGCPPREQAPGRCNRVCGQLSW